MKMLVKSFLIILLAYLFLFQVLAAWQFTTDDTYISLKYAKNLVDFGVLTWHPDMPIVEGYSNFLFVLLAALTLKLGGDPVLVLKLVSALMLALAMVGLYRLCRLWFMPRYAIIPVLWLLWYKGQILWSVSGLETSSYQFFILLAVFSLLRGLGYEPVDSQSQHQFQNKNLAIKASYFCLGGLCLSLAGLSRPEAPAMMLTLLVCLVCHRSQFQSNKRELIHAMLLTCSIILLIYCPYFIWRWHYYGHFFPNSVYCKWLTNVDIGMLDFSYLKLTIPLLILAIPYVLKYKDYRVVYLMAPSVSYLLLLYNADSVVGFFNRLFLPALILLMPLPLAGICVLVKRYANKKSQHQLVYATSLLVALLLIPSFSLQLYQKYSENSVKGIELRTKIAMWLKLNYPSSTHIVLGDCGQIPYLTQFRIIDSYCLNSTIMTSAKINNSYPLFINWILKQQPELIILMSWHPSGKTIFSPAAIAFQKNTTFLQNYQQIKKFQTQTQNNYYRYTIYKKLERST